MLKDFTLIGEHWAFRFYEVDEDVKEDGLLALPWTCHMELVSLGQHERFKKVGWYTPLILVISPDWLSTLSYPAPNPELTLVSFVLSLLVGFGWVISPRPIGGNRMRSGYYHSSSLYIFGLDVPEAKSHSSVGCPSPPHSLFPQVPWSCYIRSGGADGDPLSLALG